MKTDDFNELSALHKAILAAKFATFPDPSYAEITASPVLAGLSNDIYDEMCRLQERMLSGSGKDWQDWRRVTTRQGYRGQWRIAVMTARRDRLFMSLNREDRIKSAKCYLSPFTCTEEELNEFLDEVDRKNGTQDVETLFKQNDLDGSMILDYSNSGGELYGDARIVLGLKKGGNCDIFFGGVKAFSVSKEGTFGAADAIPVLKKYKLSSGSLQKLDALFGNERGKVHIAVEAETVDYWV